MDAAPSEDLARNPPTFHTRLLGQGDAWELREMNTAWRAAGRAFRYSAFIIRGNAHETARSLSVLCSRDVSNRRSSRRTRLEGWHRRPQDHAGGTGLPGRICQPK